MDKPIPEAVMRAVAEWEQCMSPLAAQAAMFKIANDLRANEAERALTAAQQQGQAVECTCHYLSPQDCPHVPHRTEPDTRPNAQPMQQGEEVIQRHVVTKYRDGSVHVADVTAPPSAPVGVERKLAAWLRDLAGVCSELRPVGAWPGEKAAARLREAAAALEAVPVGAVPIMKGIGKINGDGWKDTTKIGQVVYVWNTEMPAPHESGQYPRVGNQCGWTASTSQYDFYPAAPEEVRGLFAALAQQPAAVDEAVVMVQKHDALTLANFATTHGGAMEQLAARRITSLASQHQEPTT